MCATCGCDDPANIRFTDLRHDHAHPHGHDHGHDGLGHGHDEHGHDGHGHGHTHEHAHAHAHAQEPDHGPDQDQPYATRTVPLQIDVLTKNDDLAAANRSWLASQKILMLNLMSSPGSGKTTLLERTVRELSGELDIGVLEGDQETQLDAERIHATGCPVVQVNTGAGCHLDADMTAQALKVLDPSAGAVLFVENVGNLVCPALFDLGEAARVVVISVTEGADKPLKYPHMFRTADLVLLNKVDLLPYVDFDPDRCLDAARMANPDVEMLRVSATRGDGMSAWYDWLRTHESRAGTPSRRMKASSGDGRPADLFNG